MFRKVFDGRISSKSDGTVERYKLKGVPGGRTCKVVQYMIKVFNADNAKVGCEVKHGPDGEIYELLATPIAPVAINSVPKLLVGASGTPDTNAAAVVGEWILPVLTIQEDSAGAEFVWADVEVWELRKSF